MPLKLKQGLIEIGHYNPPTVWAADTQITLNTSQWRQMVKDVQEQGKLEGFKQWLNGKLIKFAKGRV